MAENLERANVNMPIEVIDIESMDKFNNPNWKKILVGDGLNFKIINQ
jgi:hypothetical protein